MTDFEIACQETYNGLLKNFLYEFEAKKAMKEQYHADLKAWFMQVAETIEGYELPEWVDQEHFGLDMTEEETENEEGTWPGEEEEEEADEMESDPFADMTAEEVQEVIDIMEPAETISFDFEN